MVRPRKPTKLLEAKGAFKANPQRSRPNEPDGKGAFPSKPPKHLALSCVDAWLEIVSIVPAGVLTGSDSIAVEISATLLSEFRLGGMPISRITRLVQELGKLGLDPSGRAKLSISKEQKNEFNQFSS